MLSNHEAIKRLQNRDSFLQKKIDEKLVAGEQTRWLIYDREALAVGIAAIEFVIATELYEASQSSPR
jgi:hypothetical protein